MRRYRYRNRRHRWMSVWTAGLALVVLLAAAGAFVVVRDNRRDAAASRHAAATATVAAFADAMTRGDVAAVSAQLDDPPADLADEVTGTRQRLDVVSWTVTPGPVSVGSRSGTAAYHADVVLRGLGTMSFDGSLPLVRRGDGYAVTWSPTVIHPALKEGQALSRTRTVGQRGDVVLPNGKPVRGADADLTANVVGTVGKYDAAQAQAAGDRFEAGDTGGLTGLERAYNDVLAGRPGGKVQVVDVTGQPVSTVFDVPVQDGQDVVTTFDPTVQAAAEAALGTVAGGKPAALVAIDAATGQVRAVANDPVAGFGRALQGTYPPGSTFKVITATAALIAGKTPDTPLECPASVTVGGRSFTNAEKEQLGTIPFSQAFAQSCNTAFINLAQSLPADAIAQAAELYGFNRTTPLLPIASPAGSYPTPTSPVEAAASAIGQGRVTASPLQMATVAAAVQSGTWRQPAVVATPVGAQAANDLPPAVADTLRTFMRSVVASGTAADAGLGPDVSGKTGTAEFGTADPPETHAWFIGFRGSLAFAVIVEGGGFGGAVAAPVAATFLAALGAG